jgi:hypothetical protein
MIDGNSHASSIAFVQVLGSVVPREVVPKVESNLRESVARSVAKEVTRLTGFPAQFSRDVMTTSLSQSLDVLTFAPAVRAEMEKGNE